MHVKSTGLTEEWQKGNWTHSGGSRWLPCRDRTSSVFLHKRGLREREKERERERKREKEIERERDRERERERERKR